MNNVNPLPLRETQILVVEDEEFWWGVYSSPLIDAGASVDWARNRDEAITRVGSGKYAIVLLDLDLSGKIEGLEVLEHFGKNPVVGEDGRLCQPQFIVLTNFRRRVDLAVKAIRAGALDFLPKQDDDSFGELVVDYVSQLVARQNERRRLRSAVTGQIIYQSPSMSEVMDTVARLAPTNGTVLIMGETGTGKELVFNEILRRSPRARARAVKQNVAALAGELVESELFGHERGAFTGAVGQHLGLFERANRGTIFLDEIGDMSLEGQARLLRILEDGSFCRVGGEREIEVDVRVVAATNQELERCVSEGKFREDLYYRLAIHSIRIPPLRERREDVRLLADHFRVFFCEHHQRTVKSFVPAATLCLERYSWPGNVRELRNVIDHAVLFDEDGYIDTTDLPSHCVSSTGRQETPGRGVRGGRHQPRAAAKGSEDRSDAIQELIALAEAPQTPPVDRVVEVVQRAITGPSGRGSSGPCVGVAGGGGADIC